MKTFNGSTLPSETVLNLKNKIEICTAVFMNHQCLTPNGNKLVGSTAVHLLITKLKAKMLPFEA